MIRSMKVTNVNVSLGGQVKGLNIDINLKLKGEEPKGKELPFSFNWTVYYGEKKGEPPMINIQGEVVAEYSNAKEVFQKLKKGEAVEPVLQEVASTVNQSCEVAAVLISSAVGLPAPLPPLLPPLSKATKAGGKRG